MEVEGGPEGGPDSGPLVALMEGHLGFQQQFLLRFQTALQSLRRNGSSSRFFNWNFYTFGWGVSSGCDSANDSSTGSVSGTSISCSPPNAPPNISSARFFRLL